MSFREESGDGRDLQKPFLHTGSWYKMGSRQSSVMGSTTSVMRDSVSVLFCVLIAALGPIQFGFTVCLVQFIPNFVGIKWKKVTDFVFFFFFFWKVWIFFSDATSYNQWSQALCFRGFVCFCALWVLVESNFSFWYAWSLSSRIDSDMFGCFPVELILPQ